MREILLAIAPDTRLPLAGSVNKACELVGGASPDADKATCQLDQEARATVEANRSLLRAQPWLVFALGVILVGCCLLGIGCLYGRRSQLLAGFGAAAAAVVTGTALAQGLFLAIGLDRLVRGTAAEWPFVTASSLYVVAWSLGVPVGLFAFVVLVVLLRRWCTRPKIELEPATPPNQYGEWPQGAELILPPPVVGPDGKPWPPMPSGTASSQPTPSQPTGAQLRWRNAKRLPPGRPAFETGICVSGGGIRSATVTLGALQGLREAGVLGTARYLFAVSGGAYMAGALQLALAHPEKGGWRTSGPGTLSAANVFAPGSVEEDHLRRHGKYLADSPGEFVVALATILRNTLASLTLLLVTVTVLGLSLGAFYVLVPLVDVDGIADAAQRTARGGDSDEEAAASDDAQALAVPGGDADQEATTTAATENEPSLLGFITPPVWYAVGVPLALAALAWMIAVFAAQSTDRISRSRVTISNSAAKGLTAVAATAGMLGIGVPAVVWVTMRAGEVADGGGIGAAATGLAGTSTLTYLGALVAMLWRRRERAKDVVRNIDKARKGVQPLEREVATGLGQLVIVAAVLAVLVVVHLAVFGAVVATGTSWPWWGWLLPLGLALVALLIDQTRLSLHPFYRKRLASAFAARRKRLPDGRTVASPYDYRRERTHLHDYGARHDGLPQVIFAAAAAFSGPERTPPGRRAASFTFSSDYIGGPDIGWVSTEKLHEVVGENIQADLTVQAAMAISGAAFASSMGRHARWYQTLLALSNARLGTWLPNPAFLDALARASDTSQPKDGWRTPRLPKVRRAPYFLREVAGSFPYDGRMLLCTDGGHYENLGLVETLRHRCRLVYCIDATGDAPPFAATLAEAITLAWEELGVTITLDGERDLVPGSAEPLEPTDPLSALNARLSKRCVVTGTIRYPAEPTSGDLKGKTIPKAKQPTEGRLVIAKTSLTGDMPYQLLSYAVANPTFPRQGTADQFFDAGQFNAYLELGREMGRRAAQEEEQEEEARRARWRCARRRRG